MEYLVKLQDLEQDVFAASEKTKSPTLGIKLQKLRQEILSCMKFFQSGRVGSRNEEKQKETYERLLGDFERLTGKPEPLAPPAKSFEVKADKVGQAKLAISRGGARKGAGRKPIGEQRRAAITLPPDDWEAVDRLRGERALADFLRECIQNELARARIQP